MKKVFITFLVLISFAYSCKSTPPVVAEPPVLIPDEVVVENTTTNIAPQPPVVEDIVVVAEEVGEFVLPFDATTRETSRGTVLVFATNALFAYGSSDLPDSTYEVFSAAKFVLENNTNINLIFETHTGNIGKATANYALSVVRMTNGIAFMNTMAIPLDRIEPIALGEALPEYTDQRKLRRYEFVIIRNEADRTKYNNFIKTISTNKETDGKVII